jgi:hypothetical protein
VGDEEASWGGERDVGGEMGGGEESGLGIKKVGRGVNL